MSPWDLLKGCSKMAAADRYLFDKSKILLEILHYFITAGSHCNEGGPLLGQGTGVSAGVSLYI